MQAFFNKQLFTVDGFTLTVLGAIALVLIVYLAFLRK